MGHWVDRVGDAALAAIDDVSEQALGWLDEALEGREPAEVEEFVTELDRVPLVSMLMRDVRSRRPAYTVAYGDVIGVQRLGYTHYGIYASDDEVVHYSGSVDETSADAAVRATSLATFLRGDTDWFVLDLAECATGNLAGLRGDLVEVETFTAEQTVARARSRLGESRYNLLWNNCEHFALWCKTGQERSFQVDSALEGAGRLLRLLVERR
jgi:hypothetical protein